MSSRVMTIPIAPGVKPQDLRGHILKTASNLFYKQGVRAFGIDLVVRATGVAKTSLYRYFPTKDDLVAAELALLVNGAFVSSELLAPEEATAALLAAARALCKAAPRRSQAS